MIDSVQWLVEIIIISSGLKKEEIRTKYLNLENKGGDLTCRLIREIMLPQTKQTFLVLFKFHFFNNNKK